MANLAVTSIQLKYRSETYLVITWIAPPLVSAVEEYRYQVSENPTEISVSKLLEANVTGLQPGKMYTINVISVDSNSRPDIQKTSVQTMLATNPAVPGPIDIGNSDLSASDGIITVRWMSTGFVDNYNVSCNDSSITIDNIYPATPQVTISGARNGKRYQLTYYAISNSLISSSYSQILRTQVTSPDPPTIIPCSADDIFSTHLFLTWQEPSNTNGDILYYLIDISGPSAPGRINTSTSVLQQNVEQLLEEQLYCFTMKTVNDGPFNIADIASSDQQCCSTKPGLPTTPRNVTFSKITSRSFQITWSNPKDSKRNIVSYRLRLKVSSACEIEIIFQCINCGATSNTSYMECTHKRRDIVNINTTQAYTMVTYTVGNLSPFVEYEVWIAAVSSDGDGDRNISMVKTDSEVPQKPINVTGVARTPHSIEVSWVQPLPRPGPITYTVKVYEENDINREFLAKDTYNKAIIGYYAQTALIDELDEFWQYKFFIEANTSVGSVNSDLTAAVRTMHAAPGKVDKFEVKTLNNAITTIEVSWSIPKLKERNGIISEYVVNQNTSGTIATEKIIAVSDQLHKFFYVIPDHYYYFEVYARNTQGQDGISVSVVYYAAAGADETKESGYSVGVVVGVSSGSVLFVLLVVGLIIIIRKVQRRHKPERSAATSANEGGTYFENLDLQNLSTYEDLEEKSTASVYDQIKRPHNTRIYENA